jgi:hypothetical protein
MTDNRKNIKIEPAVFDRHNDRRQDLGLSWTEYLRRCEYDNRDTDATGDSTDGIQREEIQDLITEIATQANDHRIDDDELARAVASKLDYAELATVVADEVENRLEQMGAGR